MTTIARERAIGVACGVMSVFLFSGNTLVSRLGLLSPLRPIDLAALRFGIGGTLLMPVLLRRGLAGTRWPQVALLPVFGGLGFAVVAYAGFSLAPAAHAAVLLQGTIPLFTFVLMSASSQHAGVRARPLGIVLITAGVVLTAYDSVAGASVSQLAGDGLLLLASLLWAAYGVAIRSQRLQAAHGAAIVAVFSMCSFLPLYLLLPGKGLLLVSTNELVLQAVVQGVMLGAVSIFIYTRAVAALGPAKTSLFSAAVPCLTTLGAVPLLGEVPGVVSAIGLGVVTLGMIVAVRR